MRIGPKSAVPEERVLVWNLQPRRASVPITVAAFPWRPVTLK